MKKLLLLSCLLFLQKAWLVSQTDPARPNILLIISDDMGLDVTPGYITGNSPMPNTPNLDALRANGVTFTNAWATPQCTPTRAGIMSGKYGIKNGVQKVPGYLDAALHTSVFKELEAQTSNAYSDAVIGKWHIHDGTDYTHPAQHGVDFYTGVFNSSVPDYYNWNKLVGGSLVNETTYATTDFTDEAISWINSRSSPWFLWLAHVAPHTPTHIPPPGTHTINTGNNFRKYLAAIEALDYEIGRMLNNIPSNVLDNTLIIFVGDNGTPNGFLRTYPAGRGKASVYQGGVNVPMIAKGAGVTRIGETEDALVNIVDIYATIVETGGGSLPGGKYNSFSFHPLLSNAAAPTRPYNYVDYRSKGTGGDDFAIRDDRYKLIQFSDGTQEFYDLLTDPYELSNLLPSLTAAEQAVYDDLETEALYIRLDWSCRDLILNGTETSIDIGGTYCAGLPVCTFDNSTNTSNLGCCASPMPGQNAYSEAVFNDIRMLSSTNFPDHDYCYNSPSQQPFPMSYYFEVDATPALAPSRTLVIDPSTHRPDIFFGMALNGVILAPAPATPFIYENPNTGEYNWDWVYEPTNNQGSGSGWVGLDCASAHKGPQGYHYHGNMFEYVEQIQPGISTTSTPPVGPLHIGWASDGFPILYRFAPDGVGGLALLQPSYQLKPGDRPGDGIHAPCGPYNGKYTNDYEYVAGAGDLDECNGISRNVTLNTVCGPQTFDYFYVITDNFPQVPRCMSGTPGARFDNDVNAEEPCYKPLYMQKQTLNSGESITVGANTYDSVGEYKDTIGNWDASCDSIVVTRITAVLPLSLLEFYARNLQDKSAYLNWTTADEVGFSHFVVQRSPDAIDWEDLGTVQGKDSPQGENYYSFSDDLSILTGRYVKHVYYRLKIMDLDGSFDYSPTRFITITPRQYLIYQGGGQLFLGNHSGIEGNADVIVVDSQGKLYRKARIFAGEGRSVIFDDLYEWNNGVYFIQARNGRGMVGSQKIIIQNR